jgi:hypothetical protein
VCAAAHAAALTGPQPAEVLQAALARSARLTRWARAARHTASGASRLASGQATQAGREHLAAAAIYADIPAITDRMLSLALAADAFSRGGRRREAELARAQVREFARRAEAPGLLRLAGSGGQRGG